MKQQFSLESKNRILNSLELKVMIEIRQVIESLIPIDLEDVKICIENRIKTVNTGNNLRAEHLFETIIEGNELFVYKIRANGTRKFLLCKIIQNS